MPTALNRLPLPGQKRIAVHVKPAAERALRQGHPWLFEQGITRQSHEGQPGDLAVIFDKRNKFLAIGLYDPDSPIRVRVLQHNTPAQIDGDWFRSTLQTAVNLRAPLNRPDTNGYRLVHGENDGLPGLIVDRYGDTLVIKLYTAAWLPHLRDVLRGVDDVWPASRWVLRLSRIMQQSQVYGLVDGQVLRGEAPDGPIIFLENGLRFAADVIQGHKTGFFFDHRENRQLVGDLSAGKAVLDVFAYAGAFSLYAARGGAHSVLSLDISAPALEAAHVNFDLNRDDPAVAAAQHTLEVGDAFEHMQALITQKRRFDMVVVDPPAFAKRDTEIDRALAAYTRLTRLVLPLLRPGGTLVMASCSSRVSSQAFFHTIQQTAAGEGYDLNIFNRTAHALDHPIGFPEGAYLKCLYAAVG